jgi:menaquinone-dependent protoporphyrinogen oxidase
MAQRHILLVYGSSYGHTARIADRITSSLVNVGCSVTRMAGDQLPDLFILDSFDGVIVAASVIRGRYQRYIEQFVKKNALVLNRMPGAFFSVSLAAASPRPESPATARADITAFLNKTGWKPARSHTIAGELAYSRYNPILRFVMKKISARAGLSTDTSHDHDYTDWQQLSHAARNFADLVAQRMAETQSTPTLGTVAMHPLR